MEQKEKGADVTLYECADFRPELVADYDAIAFGCPAMGDEVLEEDEFEPMFDGCKAELKDKKIALFGSYGWGDGEWMRNWEESCKEAGAVLATESVICNDMPDDDGVETARHWAQHWHKTLTNKIEDLMDSVKRIRKVFFNGKS